VSGSTDAVSLCVICYETWYFCWDAACVVCLMGYFLAFNAVMYHFCCTVAEYCLTGIVTLYWRLLFSGWYDYTDQCVGMHDSVWQTAGSACEVTSRRENSKVVYFSCAVVKFLPWVLWRCWLGGRKGIRPVKNWVVGAGVVICLVRGADLHTAQLMPLPLSVSCFSKIQIGFTFLVPAHPGNPGQRAFKWVCVCVCCG